MGVKEGKEMVERHFSSNNYKCFIHQSEVGSLNAKVAAVID